MKLDLAVCDRATGARVQPSGCSSGAAKANSERLYCRLAPQGRVHTAKRQSSGRLDGIEQRINAEGLAKKPSASFLAPARGCAQTGQR